MAATVALLPIHFVGANTALLDPTFPPSAVPGELSSRNTWNWLRTTLAIAATVAGCQGLSVMVTNRMRSNPQPVGSRFGQAPR
jgi:hypothetical protein